jgi:hypothetical protein
MLNKRFEQYQRDKEKLRQHHQLKQGNVLANQLKDLLKSIKKELRS